MIDKNETTAHLSIDGYEEGPGVLVTLAGVQYGLQRVVQRVRIHPLLRWPAARRTSVFFPQLFIYLFINKRKHRKFIITDNIIIIILLKQ
jgi:hypothetical protein